ncbi:Uncharacterised protein [Vibrio cholerae]|nr:Uncharacterised protein [Vibrio cholerae]
MLLILHASRELFDRVIFKNRYFGLQNDWTAIELLSDKMHAGTMLFIARVDSSLISVQSRILWQ